MAEVTYYWDVRLHDWETNPDNMIDGNLATFASTASDGDYETLSSTTCEGTNLGTITKVEIRCYAYGDGDDRIDFSFNQAGAGPTTPEYQTTPALTEGWTVPVDVTDDSNVNGWTWAKIADLITETGLSLIVEYDKVGKGNTMHCAKVEIRVTYTPTGPPGYPYHRKTLKGTGKPYSGRRGFDETTGHRRGFWP